MRNRSSDSTKMTNPASPAYKALFRPASIAVVGGSESLHKPGERVLTNIIRHGYGGTLWVVNPCADSVSGVTSFKTIGGLPAVPELAIIAIPAPFVLASLEELARIGTKAAIVLTSGFGEKDEKGNIDVIVVMVANPRMSENDAVYREVSTAMDVSAIPLIPVLNSTTTCAALIQGFVADGKCYFQDEVPLGRALGKVVHRPRLGEAAEETENYDRESIGKLLDGQRGILTPGLVASVLTKPGFGLPLQAEVISRDKLALSCDNVGYPLAMKVVGPLHKSDSGGVKLGIQSIEAALADRDELMGIDGATAVLVQQMVGGTEVILGASRTDDLSSGNVRHGRHLRRGPQGRAVRTGTFLPGGMPCNGGGYTWLPNPQGHQGPERYIA